MRLVLALLLLAAAGCRLLSSTGPLTGSVTSLRATDVPLVNRGATAFSISAVQGSQLEAFGDYPASVLD